MSAYTSTDNESQAYSRIGNTGDGKGFHESDGTPLGVFTLGESELGDSRPYAGGGGGYWPPISNED